MFFKLFLIEKPFAVNFAEDEVSPNKKLEFTRLKIDFKTS